MTNITLQNKLLNFWESVLLPSEGESNKDEYNILLNLLDVDYTNFHMLPYNQKKYKIRKYVTVESLHPNSLRTLITKLSSSKQNIQVMKLLQILEALLIGKEKDLKPFWTESIKEQSKKLWLPVETGYVDLGLNSYTTSLNNTMSNSWFSIKQTNPKLKNSLMTSSQLLLSSQLDTMARENTKILRSRKIKLYLNSNQKKKIKSWIDTGRYVYNKTISFLKENKYPGKHKLRDMIVTNYENDWEKNTPQGIRAGCLFDACQAYENGVSRLKKTGHPFNLKFRSKKKVRQQTISLPLDGIKKGLKLYPRLLGKDSCLLIPKSEKQHIKFKTKYVNEMKYIKLPNGEYKLDKNGKKMKEKTGKKLDKGKILEHEIRIQMTKTGKWYLCVPVEMEIKSSENQGAIVSLDPGVRTFMTGYSPDGQVYKFGDRDIKTIRNYLLKTDKLCSKLSKLTGRKKYTHKRAYLKRLENVRNRVKDCHRKVVKFLVDRYDIIILPPFASKNMSSKQNRRINSKTVRNMITWSHYKFRQMLMSKILEYKDKYILLPSEAYTSKTCGRCGNIKSNLGGNEIYKCDKCGLKIDRDINGSRNILLRTINSLSEVIASTCLTLGPLSGN